jgi:hypothetical protein
MKKHLFIALALLIGMATAQAQSITAKELRASGFSQAKFKKAPKRVYINSFNIFFQVVGSASASTVGGEQFGMAHSSTNTHMGVGLDGVDTDDFLAITNAGYRLFIESLQQNGFELVNADEAGNTSLYQGWLRKEGGELSTAEVPGHVRATPEGFTYFVRGEKRSGKEKSTFFDRAPALSKELDDATIVDVNFCVHFVDMKTFSSELLNVSNVKGKINFKVTRGVGTSTDLITSANFSFGKTLTAATGQVTNDLKKDLAIEAKVFSDEKFSETNVAASRSVPNYHKVLFVGSQSVQVSHYATANRALYVSESERLLGEFLSVSLANFYKHALK